MRDQRDMGTANNVGYYLPRDTARALTEARLKQCKNLVLLLDKYAPQAAIDKSEGKGTWLKQVEAEQYIDERLTEQIYQRWLNTTKASGAIHFSGQTDWRMVVGLGGETVLETDMTLHHLYGIPFIPGSALKGLTRAYVTKEIEGYKSAKIEEDKPDILRIFGSQNSAGTVVFFDAMPMNGKVEVALDIMNPHYPNYYQTQNQSRPTPPTNDQNPNPVTFLTVVNTTFMFALAPRRPNDAQHQQDVQQVRSWLQSALQDYGVGGKTSAGYGAFQKLADVTVAEVAAQTATKPATPTVVDPEVQRATALKQELEVMKDSDVAARINNYHQQWQRLKSPEARTILANAIIAKVRKAGRERVSADRPWYKELLAFLENV